MFADAHGVELSYGDIARRSQGRLTRSRVQQMASTPIRAMPSPDSVKGLALGLGVPESVVTQRAMASAGYEVPADWHSSLELRQVDYVKAATSPDHPDSPRGSAADAASVEEEMTAALRKAAGRKDRERR